MPVRAEPGALLESKPPLHKGEKSLRFGHPAVAAQGQLREGGASYHQCAHAEENQMSSPTLKLTTPTSAREDATRHCAAESWEGLGPRVEYNSEMIV